MNRKRLLTILAVWICIALLTATQTILGLRGEGVQGNEAKLFLRFSLQWCVWALATPLVFWMGSRFGWRGTGRHAIVFFSIALANAVWGTLLQAWLKPWGNGPNGFEQFWNMTTGMLFSQFHISLFLYVGILALSRSLESQKVLVEAQLAALRKQLEPHFLFNTLHGIAGMVRDGKNDAAVTMIAKVSELLRQVLDGADRQMSTLHEEIEFLERYVEVQKMRFGDDLRLEVNVPYEMRQVLIPSLILQPLIENAIQHGISRREAGGKIWVDAAMQNKMLVLRVKNEGPVLGSRPEGVGIKNTRTRLNTLYGGNGRFSIEDMPGGVLAELRITR